MNTQLIDKWISAIVQEDGHNLSSGSLRTLKMIRDEIQSPSTEVKGQQGVEDLVKKIEFWTKRYEFSFQFWGEGQNNVYINKDFIEVASFGGYKTIESALLKVINWCEKSNPRIKYD